MEYRDLLPALNQYAKNIAQLVYQEYREFFGVEDDLNLYRLSTANEYIVEITPIHLEDTVIHSEKIFKTAEKIRCNLSHPSLIGKTVEEQFEILKRLLPYEIFSYIIRPNNIASLQKEEWEYANFLTKGLIELFTEEFARKHNIRITYQHQNNASFANELLSKIPPEINKYKMVFQQDFKYMSEMYQLITGRNIYKKYKQEYLKDEDIEILKKYVDKYILNIEEKERIITKIIVNGTYNNAIQELSSYLIASKNNLGTSMEELSTLFKNYPIEKRNVGLKREKKSNGFSRTSIILISAIVLGLVLMIFVSL